MREVKQTEGKEVRFQWTNIRELIFRKVDDERLELSIEEEGIKRKVELSIVEKNMKDKKKDPLYISIEKRSKLFRSFVVFPIVAVFLLLLNYHVNVKLGVPLWWCLLPIIALGVGLLVQSLDVFLPWGQPEHIDNVYEEKKRKKSDKES